jgi:hypothetical protein
MGRKPALAVAPLRPAPRWAGAVLWSASALAAIVVAAYVGYAMVATGHLFSEQFRMGPRDQAQFHLEGFRVAPQGFVYYVTSTSAPAVVLDQGMWTHTPVAFGRVARADGQWVVLVAEPHATSAQELGIWLRNAGGYWITESPLTYPDSFIGSDEWGKLWAEAQQVPAIGPRFADAIAR